MRRQQPTTSDLAKQFRRRRYHGINLMADAELLRGKPGNAHAIMQAWQRAQIATGVYVPIPKRKGQNDQTH